MVVSSCSNRCYMICLIQHSYVLLSWGSNRRGQLGIHREVEYVATPSPVLFPPNDKLIAAEQVEYTDELLRPKVPIPIPILIHLFVLNLGSERLQTLRRPWVSASWRVGTVTVWRFSRTHSSFSRGAMASTDNLVWVTGTRKCGPHSISSTSRHSTTQKFAEFSIGFKN